MPDDPQQARIYAAESVLDGTTRQFATAAEVRAYLQTVVADEVVGERWPDAEVPDVHLGPHNLSCSYATTDGVIVLRRDHLDLHSVLHEFAHTLTPGDGHGPQFCTAYALLVRRFVGVVAWAALTGAFDELVLSWQDES